MYCHKYNRYLYVDPMGELVRPDYLTRHFPLLLKKHGLRKIRFHNLRRLLYANGVSQKEIQEWLGHSDISTTSKIASVPPVEAPMAITSILPKLAGR